jgi:hypothetical protein
VVQLITSFVKDLPFKNMRSLIAVCQLNVQHDIGENFRRSAGMIERAGAIQGCKVRFFCQFEKN